MKLYISEQPSSFMVVSIYLEGEQMEQVHDSFRK